MVILNECFEIMWLVVVGSEARYWLHFLGKVSQTKLYMNQNLHHDLVNYISMNIVDNEQIIQMIDIPQSREFD